MPEVERRTLRIAKHVEPGLDHAVTYLYAWMQNGGLLATVHVSVIPDAWGIPVTWELEDDQVRRFRTFDSTLAALIEVRNAAAHWYLCQPEFVHVTGLPDEENEGVNDHD